MSRTHKSREQVWAVIRVDEFLDESTPWCNRITVKEVVRTKELADAEVIRLTKLNEGKQCVYFVSMTRLFPDGAAAGLGEESVGDGGVG